MPKKRQDRALLIKPGSSTVIASPSRSAGTHDGAKPSVNDLIRESRRLQLRSQPAEPASLTASVPPPLRDVLSLPTPQAPAPRPYNRRVGPSRSRPIPGPPPPRSWLLESRHAPPHAPQPDFQSKRLQHHTASLPGQHFPSQKSLLHHALRSLATNWEWHVDYDGMYLTMLPTKLREALLSYLAVYNDNINTNPLRLLLVADEEPGTRPEVTRLDLGGGVGQWTSLKKLDKDLASIECFSSTHASSKSSDPAVTGAEVPESWDAEDDPAAAITHDSVPRHIPTTAFTSLRHLSLALSPTLPTQAQPSWSSLLTLSSHVTTIQSLSLAYWRLPTFTPVAASTRATIASSTSNSSPRTPPTTYGGTNIYSHTLDNDYRESAGILRTLSRNLYCLQWLDLSGCGDWFGALCWTPPPSSTSPGSSPSSGGSGGEDLKAKSKYASRYGPDWNGSWRSLTYLCLSVGWTPVAPESEPGSPLFEVPPVPASLASRPDRATMEDPRHSNRPNRRSGHADASPSWSVEHERLKYQYKREVTRFNSIVAGAQDVIRHVRSVRKAAGGKWLDVEHGDRLSQDWAI